MNFLFVIVCSLLRAVIAQPSVLSSNDSSIRLSLLEGAFHTVDVLDVSNMTVDSKNNTFSGLLLDLLPSPSAPIPHNVSTVDVDESKLTYMDYGGHTLFEGCQEAARLLPNNNRRATYGQRSLKGFVDHMVPYLVISCISIEHAQVDAVREINNRVAVAARKILTECVHKERKGGEVTRLGEGGHLRIAMIRPSETEQGEITCFDSPGGAPMEKACTNELTLVPSIDIQQNFGPKGTSGVQVDLPMGWRERDPPGSGCAIAANTRDRVVVGISWAYLFEADSAINAKCVRQGKSGIWIGHGTRDRNKKIFIGLYKEKLPTIDTA